MDDHQPRIIARGEWEQDEHGGLLYIPRHLTPPMGDARGEPGDDDGPYAAPDPMPQSGRSPSRGGYHRASEEAWARARQDYLDGDTAETACLRHGMGLSTFRARAREEGWRRVDAPDLEPVDLEAETEAGLPDYADMARHALVRLNRAILRGRSTEAGGWMRLHARLLAQAEVQAQAQAQAQAQTQAADDAKVEAEVAAAPGTETDAEPAAAPAAKPAAKPPVKLRLAKAFDPQAETLARARTLQTLVRAVSIMDPKDETGRKLINKSMEVLDALKRAPISDDSDVSDAVFSPPPSETPPEPPEAP